VTAAETPLPTRRLNPAEVLLALRDFHVCVLDEEPDWVAERIRPDTPLIDLPYDDLDFAFVLRYLGVWPPPAGWDRQFGKSSRVADLCVVLSELMEVPTFEPVTILGTPSLPAGAFLAVRRLLAERGADVSRLAPSTPLADYLYRHSRVFNAVVPLMAPGRVPPLRLKNAKLCRRVLGVFLAVTGLGLAWLVGRAAPAVAGVVAGAAVKVGVIDLILIPLAARRDNWSVEFGGLYDFRDLVDTMLDRPLRRRATAQPLELAP
jgi:hypothetical protein